MSHPASAPFGRRSEPRPGPDRQLRFQRADRSPRRHRLVLHAALRRRSGVPRAARPQRERQRVGVRAGGLRAQRAGYEPNTAIAAHAPVRPRRPGHRDRRLRAALLSAAAASSARSRWCAACELLSGSPRMRVGVRPRVRMGRATKPDGHAGQQPHPLRRCRRRRLRLNTDAPLTYVLAEDLVLVRRPADELHARPRRDAGRRHRGHRARLRAGDGRYWRQLDPRAWPCRWSGRTR